MSKDGEKLNVVNEQGEIIGEETREEIHRKGLLHREVHVWLYTPGDEILFQHRAKDKDTYPDLLDASVGGHVEIGDDFEIAALKELEEEAGIKASIKELKYILTMRSKSYDEVTGMTNNVIRAVYAYKYTGDIKDLRVEEGKSQGFEAWELDEILNIKEENRNRFIESILVNEDFQKVFREIKKL